MGSFCGSGSQTVVNTSSNPNVTAQQNTIYGVVNGITDQYAPNPSSLVAPWNSIQTDAAQGIADQATANLPWNYLGQGLVGTGADTIAQAPSLYNQAQTQLGNSVPITANAWNPTAYESPYTQDVINATMANINRTNAIQQNGALGNAISQGNAFGGDRAGVAMGELARNQALASNQTMAQLQQADFNQASQQANAQQQYGLNVGLAQNAQQLQLANAYSGLGSNMVQTGLAQGNLGAQTANLGNQGQSGALSGLGALFNAGSSLQQTQQQQTSAPLTLAQWMATNSPGTGATPTSTTYPGASPAATLAGLGLTGVAGAGLLSNLGAFAGLLNRGGRVNKQDGGSVGGGNDLVDRYHQILGKVKAYQSGGQAGPPQEGGTQVYQDPISQNVGKSGDTAVTKGYNELRRASMLENLQTAHPLMKVLAYNQMQTARSPGTPGAFQLGGEVDPVTGGKGIPGLGTNHLLKLGQMGINTINGQGNSPTRAPHAPNAGGGMNPQDILKLAQLGGMGGGMAGLGGYQEGGFVDDVGDGPSMLGGPRDDVPAPARGFDPYRYMDKPAPGSYASAQASPWMAALAAGLGILGKAGARDAHGLPISGAAAIGQGAQQGLDVMKQQVEQEQKRREAALRARQLEAEWAQHQAQLRQQAGIALGMLNGEQTIQGKQADLAATKQAEELRVHNRPTWGVIGQNRYGEPQYGWINPNLAPNNPGGLGGQPSSSTGAASPGSAVVGSTSANTPNVPDVAPSASADSSRSAIVPGQPTTEVGNPDLSGADFLATLPPADQAQVKAVVEGRFQPPGSFALKSPRVQRLLQWAAQYEPGFDYTKWAARSATAKDFASGKSAQNLTSFNTALEHMDRLDQAVQDLHNLNVPLGSLARSVTNPVFSALSPDVERRINKFNIAKTAVVDELTRAFRGTGGNVHDLVQWEKSLSAASSEASLRGAIKEGMQLLDSRIGALGDQYARGMGRNVDPIQLLSPKAQAIHDRIVGGQPKADAAAHVPRPAVGEGATAINKETGQRIIMKDGKWQPIQ